MNSLAGRRGRTALLVVAVAMAAMLTTGVSSAIATVEAALSARADALVGTTDIVLTNRFTGPLPAEVMERVRAWPEVESAGAVRHAGVTLRHDGATTRPSFDVLVTGLEPAIAKSQDDVRVTEGKMIERDGEVVLDQFTARALGVKVGDVVTPLGENAAALPGWTVVGLFPGPPEGLRPRPALATVAQVVSLSRPPLIDRAEMKLKPGVDADAFIARHAADLPPEDLMQTPGTLRARMTAGLTTMRLLYRVGILLIMLAAAFIILTALTTAVNEQMRELGILRCIGASRGQVALAQVVVGATIGAAGALPGVPLGLLLSWLLTLRYPQVLGGAWTANWDGAAWSVVVAVLAGTSGAAYPAFVAVRVRPVEALRVRARRPRGARIALCLALGAAGVLATPLWLSLRLDNQVSFWGYFYVGLPLKFVGYFLLSVPVFWLIVQGLGGAIARILQLPRALLRQSTLATPFRHAFTAGALMVGLAMLVEIWMSDRSVLADWTERVRGPDAVAIAIGPLPQGGLDAVAKVKGVAQTSRANVIPVRTHAGTFGIAGSTPRLANLVVIDPADFFDVVPLEWDEGDAASARAAMQRGGAVIVGREYKVVHGIGKGGKLTLDTLRGPVEFDVAGVVDSPGLEVAVHTFKDRQPYGEAATTLVLASAADAKHDFLPLHLAQMTFVNVERGADVDTIVDHIGRQTPGTFVVSIAGVVNIVNRDAEQFRLVSTVVAVSTLLIACLGVGNLIISEIVARRHEYGILRAIGARRGLLARLIAAQTLLVALCACVLGTALGMHLALTEHVFHERMVGLLYATRWPWDVAAWGSVVVIVASLLAATPAVGRILLAPPRTLLAAGRGG